MPSVPNKPLVVIGSVNVDLVFEVHALPKPGETIPSKSLSIFPGGKGANQAAAAAKLDYPSFFVGQVGKSDPNTVLLKDALTSSGAKLDYLKEIDGPCGTALILLQDRGENSIVIVGGANHSSWKLDSGVIELITSAGVLLLQREIPESVNVQAAAIAYNAGVPVILDAGGSDEPIDPALLKLVTVVSPNETELARLTSLPTDSEEAIEAAVAKLLSYGVSSVLVKLGADGSLLYPGGGSAPLRQTVVPGDSVIDTTGAGDCFTAAYAVAFLEGLDPQARLRFASAAASICVGRKGAMPSMPTRAEVEALLTKA